MQLLAIGFSRQKARYGRALAAGIVDGTLDLDGLDALDDDGVQEAPGGRPGHRSLDLVIYLLMVLGRPDVWPIGDIALASAVGAGEGSSGTSGAATLMRIGEAWRPWRSVAARLLWHDYLARRRRAAGTPVGADDASM